MKRRILHAAALLSGLLFLGCSVAFLIKPRALYGFRTARHRYTLHVTEEGRLVLAVVDYAWPPPVTPGPNDIIGGHDAFDLPLWELLVGTAPVPAMCCWWFLMHRKRPTRRGFPISRTPIDGATAQIERAIEEEVRRHATEKFWVTHYGANHIHPKHLVYWIVVQSDGEKSRLGGDSGLMARLRSLLDLYQYPVEGRDGVHIGFESQETVDRESGGNFYHHWK